MFLWEQKDNSWYGIYVDNIIKFSVSMFQRIISIAIPEVIKIPLFISVLIQRSRDGKEKFSELTMTLKK